MQNKRYGDFWKEVRSRKPRCTQTDREIDGKKSSTDIAALFADKFSAVNGRNDDVTQDNHINDTENIENIWVKRMSYKDVATGIRKLKIGIGYDGVHSKHLKFADRNFIDHICRFFNSCLVHHHIPEKMLQSVVNPSMKNNAVDGKKSSNYREITISTCFLKLFEYCLLPTLQSFLPICINQFGYRPWCT